MSNDILDYLAKKIREEMAIVQESMVDGNLDDFADYKYSCGVYRGLLIANNILSETKERMEQDDE